MISQVSQLSSHILVTSHFKFLEKIIAEQLVDYFTTNNLFCIQQFGFRSGHSTELAALKLANHLITEIGNFKVPTNIYIDLSKAFDTLNFDILLKKLDHYGINESAKRLIHSYLTDRLQFAEFNSYKSTYLPISTGVPQGSVNEEVINVEVAKLSEWLGANKLALNISKTKYMVFSSFFFFRKNYLLLSYATSVRPSVCPSVRPSVRLSVRPSVEIISFRGNSLPNRPIELKISLNVREGVVHVRKAWFFEILIASCKFMQFAIFCK